jgi:hypothetical protein
MTRVERGERLEECGAAVAVGLGRCPVRAQGSKVRFADGWRTRAGLSTEVRPTTDLHLRDSERMTGNTKVGLKSPGLSVIRTLLIR